MLKKAKKCLILACCEAKIDTAVNKSPYGEFRLLLNYQKHLRKFEYLIL